MIVLGSIAKMGREQFLPHGTQSWENYRCRWLEYEHDSMTAVSGDT